MLSPNVHKKFRGIGLAKYDGMMEIGGIDREVRTLRKIMTDLLAQLKPN